MLDINNLKAERYKFLSAVYESASANSEAVFEIDELGEELGFSYDQTHKHVNYLISEGLLNPFGFGGLIKISHSGIKEVEEAVSNPKKPTEHFDPIINYNIYSNGQGNVVNTGNDNSFNISHVINNSAIQSALVEIEAFLLDETIEKSMKNDIRVLLNTLNQELEEGMTKKETAIRLLDMGEKEPSIASKVISIFRNLYKF